MQRVLDLATARARQRRGLPPPETRRRLRELAGLRLEDVADALDVSIPTISRWETGLRSPRDEEMLTRYMELLERLAREGMRA